MVTNAFAYEYIATIINVADGDTFTAFVHNENTKIRLIGVDCYETKMNKRAPIQKNSTICPILKYLSLASNQKRNSKICFKITDTFMLNGMSETDMVVF